MKNMSMAEYAPPDFQRYFGGAAFIHPVTRTIGFVVSMDGNIAVIMDMDGNNLPPLDYRNMTFEMFQERPPLGYRHTDDGKYLYYISRRAMRQTGKGIRASTISITRVGEVVRLHELAGTGQDFARSATYGIAIINAIYNPQYKDLKEAVHELRNGTAFGFALSHQFAITLLSTEGDYPFVLLFKGQRAALSKDGSVWDPTHPEFVELIVRSLPSIVWEK